MTEYSVRIENWHPARINQWDGCHWSKRSWLKHQDRTMIGRYMRAVIPATGKRTLQITIILGYRQRGGDPDAYWKSTCDALVYNKLLVDDNKENVELLPVVYERSTDGKPATIIKLTEAA